LHKLRAVYQPTAYHGTWLNFEASTVEQMENPHGH